MTDPAVRAGLPPVQPDAPRRRSTPKGGVRRVNLALQGGGAHGAFTWGVLERFLEEPTIEIAGLSGTSAGALNAAAVKAGLSAAAGEDGRRLARKYLADIWDQVANVPDLRVSTWASDTMMKMSGPMQRWFEMFSPTAWVENWMRVFSPYDYGGLYRDPLRPVIERLPFDAVRSPEGPKLFISATNVRTGKIRVFSGSEVGSEAVLASACLPTVFRAVEIDDPATGRREAYWDGGYSGNPALFPLFDAELPRDIVVVSINPLIRADIPRTPSEIEDRINEISFNSALLRELRAINFVRRLIADDVLENNSMKDVLIHLIADDALMSGFDANTKLMPQRAMIGHLYTAGREAADRWIEQHAAQIGVESSVDVVAMFS